ncbi:hypothetical protein F5X99DRAFT_408626 [Biscogniauxia marginata]|nr:hypothetical protein F5X99DRAFT_408626 [Biscogniauxia marginata]
MLNTLNLPGVVVLAIGFLATGATTQNIRNYSCNNQPNICSNICFWQICVHPDQTTYTYDSAGPVAQRRTDCGVTHNPRPCQLPNFANPGDEADEFPFASMAEGGRTPYGDGASLLCVPSSEQRVQGGVITQMYRGLAQGTVFELALQNTDGIPYCDPSATPNPGSCDGADFNGVHYFPDDDIYCQWDVDASRTISCVDGQDGSLVDPPARLRLRDQEPKQANWSALLHIREPELVRRLAAPRPVGLKFDA